MSTRDEEAVEAHTISRKHEHLPTSFLSCVDEKRHFNMFVLIVITILRARTQFLIFSVKCLLGFIKTISLLFFTSTNPYFFSLVSVRV